MDSFFKQRFNAAKCKTLLKLTIPRIKLLRNRRDIQLKQMRRDIAKLLETGQEATARIRVEHIIREEKMMAAQEIIELFCELISVRLPIIEAQRECPLDLKEAISSVCFAAPRCADLTELIQVQMLFAGKYGKEFVAAATELMPECGVNRQIVELLSIRAPAPDVKLKLLKEIAEEYELDWDPSASENELLKPHEDLLNGPSQFVSGSRLPLPEEKHDETTTTPKPANNRHSDSDEDFDIIDFPEVPKQPLQPNKGTASAPEMLPFPASALSSEVDDQEEPHPSESVNFPSHLDSKHIVQEKSVSSGLGEEKQFVPFISPPLQSFPSFPVNEQIPPPSISRNKNEHVDLQEALNPPPSRNKNEHVDLQEVLAAAQAAAESADRAAAAARSAANMARLRISELVKKNNEVSGSTVENPFHTVEERADLDRENSTGDNFNNALASHGQNYNHHHPTAHPSYDDVKGDSDSSPDTSNHQPQRLPSMDDDTYLDYPNLFTTQGSNLSSRSQSFNDSK